MKLNMLAKMNIDFLNSPVDATQKARAIELANSSSAQMAALWCLHYLNTKGE